MATLPPLQVVREGREAKFHGSWYRGETTNFIPSKADLHTADAVVDYVLKGWVPPEPVVSRDVAVTAFGSCFARHISKYLKDNGYNVHGSDLTVQKSHLIRFGEGMVNSFAILQQFEWALEGRPFPADLWFSEHKEIAEVDPEVQADTKRLIAATDVFIITLGLSEIWYDKSSGDAFWRAVPQHLFDPARHGFRVSSVEENYSNLSRICDLVQQQRPGAKIIFTLSPVPLVATFRPVSCITASVVSKAILRVAIDELMRARGGADILYFPSYEIVTQFFVDAFREDNRHPKQEVVDFIMRTFEENYCAR